MTINSEFFGFRQVLCNILYLQLLHEYNFHLKLKVKVAYEWQEQVTGLDLEIKHGNYSVIDAQAPLSTHVRPGEARLWLLAESRKQ